eukprot:GEMP01106621.1.p1 GENE.GEMP01106621.1~~GEMP01106621.1.p1  ORF type:complete len:110 (+),score=17.49 GEMP01106621.1:164-493(+)
MVETNERVCFVPIVPFCELQMLQSHADRIRQNEFIADCNDLVQRQRYLGQKERDRLAAKSTEDLADHSLKRPYAPSLEENEKKRTTVETSSFFRRTFKNRLFFRRTLRS